MLSRFSLKSVFAISFLFVGLLLFGCGGQNTPYDPIITTTTGGGDFSIAAVNSAMTLQEFGASTKQFEKGDSTSQVNFDLKLTSMNGFAGGVNLAVSNPNSSEFRTVLQSTAALSAGASTDISLGVQGLTSTIPAQGYSFKVTATSGSLSHSATCTVNVVNADFNITPGTQTQTYQDQNGAAPVFTFPLSATSLGNLTGTITLTVTSPTNSGASDLSAALPSSVTISSAGGSKGFNLVLTADDPSLEVGSYTYVVSGQIHGVTRTAQCTVTVTPQQEDKMKAAGRSLP